MKSVRVTVPASTSNLGSGFDTLGLAINCHLEVFARETTGQNLAIHPASTSLASAQPIIKEAAEPWLDLGPGLEIEIRSEVPVGRGLGASAALRVGVIAACSTIRGQNLTRQQLLDRAYALEHHPDNASPALFGGFTVSGFINGSVHCRSFEVDPGLKLVTAIPPFELPTSEARRVLPDTYSRAHAAHSLNRAALVVAAFAARDYPALKGTFDDVLHQPYRAKLIPQLTAAIEAGEKAGAIGGFLSGAGSAVICLALHNADRVATAMKTVMPESSVRVFSPENRGCLIR